MNDLIQLNESLYMFDLYEHGQAGRTCAYLYNGPKKVLIETGAATSHAHILTNLKQLDLTPDDLDYVILTHIHLDHSGGAGKLASVAKNAIFVAHPRAARHLIDPSKLIQGATEVYGAAMDSFFGEILPIPQERVMIRENGETLDIGDRMLTFFDTPGHAKHHFVIHDPKIAAVFSGDSLGVRYVKAFTKWDFEFVMPSTSPTDFDPEGIVTTVEKIRGLNINTVYHTHFGPSPAEEAFAGTLTGAKAFLATAERVFAVQPDWEAIQEGLKDTIKELLQRQGHVVTGDLHEMQVDLELNAKGLWVFESRKAQRQ